MRGPYLRLRFFSSRGGELGLRHSFVTREGCGATRVIMALHGTRWIRKRGTRRKMKGEGERHKNRRRTREPSVHGAIGKLGQTRGGWSQYAASIEARPCWGRCKRRRPQDRAPLEWYRQTTAQLYESMQTHAEQTRDQVLSFTDSGGRPSVMGELKHTESQTGQGERVEWY